jgi:CDP-paratose 2-epimerase
VELLVTGGAGFVGASVSLALAERHPEWRITALDNLRRRGSELNVPRLEEAGVRFRRGDVRRPAEIASVGTEVDAVVECSAEPSVLAGVDGDVDYTVQTNLFGAYHCLELARRAGAQMVFLSTSRVYPYGPLNDVAYEDTGERFELSERQSMAGVTAAGISEDFALQGPRTLYGTTKLAAEHLIEEYRAAFGLRAVVNRLGVVAGPWQMGRVDQGVFAYWALAHHLGRPLAYIGFGGQGKQVRDLIHVGDVVDLVERQLLDPEGWDGQTLNVGGGRECSLSLLETTRLCAELSGRQLEIGSDPETRPGDVPIYITDCSALYERTDWRPQRGAREILADIFDWLDENPGLAEAILDPTSTT